MIGYLLAATESGLLVAGGEGAPGLRKQFKKLFYLVFCDGCLTPRTSMSLPVGGARTGSCRRVVLFGHPMIDYLLAVAESGLLVAGGEGAPGLRKQFKKLFYIVLCDGYLPPKEAMFRDN